MLKSIDVRSLKKTRHIVDTLKKQGRTAFYEQFADHNGFFYVIFYR